MLPLVALYLFSAVSWYLVRDHLPPGAVALAIKAALWLIPAGIYARQSAVTAFALGPPARAGLLRALLAGAGYFGLIVALSLAAEQGLPVIGRPPLPALALLVVNCIVEEAAFRGFLLLRLARKLRFWKANVLIGLAFVAVHVPTFFAAGPTPMAFTACAILFVFSLTLGEATRATGSIWIAVAIHALNNLLG